MNESKQKRVLLIIIAILLLTNAATLAVFFMHKPGYRKHDRNARKNNTVNYLKSDLGFNEMQILIYDSMHKKHMINVESLYKEMRNEKEKGFKYLAEKDFDDSVIAIAGSKIGEKQKGLEVQMLKHLREMRSIGTPAQQSKFDTTFYKFMSREKGRHKKMKR